MTGAKVGVAPGSPRSPRIGVSGSAGTGKTAFGQALANALEVRYLEEGMRGRLEGGLDLHAITHEQHRDLHVELFDELMVGVDGALADSAGFVSDRTPLDMAAFWIYYRFAFDQAQTDDFLERSRRALAPYDAIVLLPWGAIPLVGDGVRATNRWLQFHYQAVLEAFARHWSAECEVWWLSPGQAALSERVEWAQRKLVARFAGKPAPAASLLANPKPSADDESPTDG